MQWQCTHNKGPRIFFHLLIDENILFTSKRLGITSNCYTSLSLNINHFWSTVTVQMNKCMPSIPLAPAALYQTSSKAQNSKINLFSDIIYRERTVYQVHFTYTPYKTRASTKTEFMLESLDYLKGALITSYQDVRFHIQVLFKKTFLLPCNDFFSHRRFSF